MPVRRCGEGFVYGILDPSTQKIVYIGETVGDIQSRLFHHLYKATDPFNKWRNNPLPKWLRELAKNGRIPPIQHLETVPSSGDAALDKRSRIEAEKRWIKIYKEQGHKLFNADRSEVMRKVHAARTPERRAEITRNGRKKMLKNARKRRKK